MRVGTEGGSFPAERHHLGQGSGAVGVGDIPAVGGVDDVPAAPEIMKRVIDADDADAVLVGELHAPIDGGIGNGRAEFAAGIPDASSLERARQLADRGAGDAPADGAAEQLIEMERLDRVVGADAVRGGGGTEPGGIGRLGLVIAALAVRGGNESVVDRFRDDVIGRHEHVQAL